MLIIYYCEAIFRMFFKFHIIHFFEKDNYSLTLSIENQDTTGRVCFEGTRMKKSYVEDGPVAVGASGREEVVVVGLTVGTPVPLEEVARAQLLRAVGAGEVLRMPGAAQRRDDLPHDGLVASTAAPLLRRAHPLARHVCVQRAQHPLEVTAARHRLDCLACAVLLVLNAALRYL